MAKRARKKPPQKGGGGSGKPGRSRRRRVLSWFLRWGLVTSIWVAVLLAGAVGWYAYDLPDIDKLQQPTRRPSVTLSAADGSVIATYGDLYGRPLKWKEIPPHLLQAILAIEDRRFFDHGGFDVFAVIRAAYVNIRSGTIRQGGSTITQQLAKNLFLTPARTVRRKVQELLISFWLEAKFTKKQIFTIYINRVYLGAGTYGVEAASRRYFGVSAREVSLHQAAVLAGLLKAPSRYTPAYNPDGAKGRAKLVLDQMVAADFLTEAQARRAAGAPLRLAARSETGGNRYFADWILEQASAYVGNTGRDLVVRTTLDPRLQEAAEKRLAEALSKNGKKAKAEQGALVALTPDGAVRALVGGKDYRKSQFNRATQALRQPGSAFKLFVYLAGIEAGLTPDDVFQDKPVRIAKWRPRNYTGRYRGPVTLRDAFARSINTVAVQVSERAGRRNVISAARRLGITSELKSHPSLALGASEVTLVELTAAYAALANGGRGVWAHGISEIRDRAGRVLYRRSGSGPGRVIDPQHLSAMHDMLTTVVIEGTGRRAAIDRPVAGKTGTSQDFRDAWFVGYTSELATGVWIGNDDHGPMKRVVGGTLPAGIWREFMLDALNGDRTVKPVRPAVSQMPVQPRVSRQRAPESLLPSRPSRRTAPARPRKSRARPTLDDNPDYQP